MSQQPWSVPSRIHDGKTLQVNNFSKEATVHPFDVSGPETDQALAMEARDH